MVEIVVKHIDGGSTPLSSKANLSTVTSALQRVELLGADTVEISVQSAVKLEFGLGDKVTIVGRDYTLNTPPKEQKLNERMFIYDLVFEGVQYDLLRANYSVNVDTTSNQIQDLSGDSLTGDLKMFLDVLLSNANRVFPGKWVLGTYPTDTETKTLVFNEKDNCLSVLQTLCSEDNYNTEFSIAISSSGVRTLNIGTVGSVFPYTFSYGKGKGLYSLNREKVSNTNIVTRLNVYGSTKNINTSKYRAFRLCLPDKSKGQSYLESPTGIANYGVWEQTKNFEDIYPHRTGTVSALGDNELKFKDTSMDFDLNEKDKDGNTLYLFHGTSAKVHFNTGNLAGYEFEASYNHDIKLFTLRPFTDENDYTFPSKTSEAFQFAPGDEYVLLDIYLPQSYIDAAEEELEEAGQEYLDKYSQPNVKYGLDIDPAFLKSVAGTEVESNIVWVGDYIPVKDDDLNVDKSIRVKGFTRDLLNEYAYKLTIADQTVSVSIINQIVSDLNGISNIVQINNLNDPARARMNYLNAQEVLSMIFDQEGDFYTDKIKPLSIDTTMLSVGAKYSQFGLVGTVFQPNYAGTKNRVVYTGGTLTHYAILNDSGNPSSWNMGNGDLVLASDDAFYIYGKCQKTGAGGSILFSTQQIMADSDPSYYHFLIGVINSPGVNNERAVALMYGFTTINGRFIRTGRVQSADGQTYFDLDTGTIQGNIRFQSGQTVEEVVSEEVDGMELGGRNFLGFLDMIQGATSGLTGKFVSGNTYITSSRYISIHADKIVISAVDDNFIVHVCYYNELFDFLGGSYLQNNSQYQDTFPRVWELAPGTEFIKITIRKSDLTPFDVQYAKSNCRIMIEKGSIPSDWNPSPEDVQGSIDDLASDIADIADDGKFTPNEKIQVRREWPNLLGNYLSWGEQGESLGIVTELAAMEAAFKALAKYLNNNVTWTQGVPLWISDAQLSVTTTIVGSTFRAKFSDYYDALNALIAKIGEVNEANTTALGYLAEAMANDTTIQGGLISTSLIKVGAKRMEELSWVEKAGINGAGEGDETPRIYAGGTLAKAVQRVAGILTNTAKFVVTQGGKIFGMDVELYGSLSTAPPGGKRILLDHDSSAMNIYDESGEMKATISSDAIIALSKLLAPNSKSVDASQSISLTKTNGSDSDTKLSAPLILPTTSDNYTVTTPPVVCTCFATQNILPPEYMGPVGAAAEVSAFLVKPDGSKILLGTVYAGAFIHGNSSSENLTIPSKAFGPLPAGSYRMKLTASVSAPNAWATASANINIQSPNNLLTGVSDVEVSRIYRNGIFLIQDANNYMYMNPTGVVEKSENAPDRPGVLLAGYVNSGGTGSIFWGPKKHSENLSTRTANGTYTVYHSAGHTGFTVQVTLGTKQSTAVVSNKTGSSFRVTTYNSGGTATDTAFEFAVFGEN